MSIQNVISFWQKVQEDKALQKRVHPQAGKVPKLGANVKAEELKELANIAKESGYTATPQEFATTESVMRFWEKVSKDKTLQGRLKPAQGMNEAKASEAATQVAKDAGFRFTPGELATVTNALQGTGWIAHKAELSDAQLEGVAGGGGVPGSPSLLLSYNAAAQGLLATSFRRIGPGSVAEYM